MMSRMMQDEWWDDSHNPSMYQYCSFLGSGFSISVLTVLIQLVAPVLIVSFAMRTSERYTESGPGTGWCGKSFPGDVVLMDLVVWCLYSVRVIPDVYDQMYCTLGDQPSTSSRLNSLRMISYYKRNDNVWMRAGFLMDRYMNGVYNAVAYLIMMLVFFLTDTTIDIILNALAIEFLVDFDNDTAAAEWYDGGDKRRFLKAASVELALRAHLRTDAFSDATKFCEAFGGSTESWPGPLMDRARAELDDNNVSLLTAMERVVVQAQRAARASFNHDALQYLTKPVVAFGFLEANMPSQSGLFARFTSCYVWSRWDAVLYSPRTSGAVPPSSAVRDEGTVPLTDVEHFDKSSTLSSFPRFVRLLLDVVGLMELRTYAPEAWKHGYVRLLLAICDALTFWASTLVVLAFPFVVMAFGPAVAACHWMF